jgi:hypothetical protein
MAYNYWENNNFLNQTWIPPEGEELSLDFDGGVIPPNVPQGRTARSAGETNVKTDIDAQMRNDSFNLGDFNTGTQANSNNNSSDNSDGAKEDKTNNAINTLNQGLNLWKTFKDISDTSKTTTATTTANTVESSAANTAISAEQVDKLTGILEMKKYGIDASGDITGGTLASSASPTAAQKASAVANVALSAEQMAPMTELMSSSQAAGVAAQGAEITTATNEASAATWGWGSAAAQGVGETAATEAGKKAAEEGGKKAAGKVAGKVAGKALGIVSGLVDNYHDAKELQTKNTKNSVNTWEFALDTGMAGIKGGSGWGPVGSFFGFMGGLGAGATAASMRRWELPAAIVKAQKSGAMAAYGGEISSKMLETYEKQYKEVPLSLEEANNLIAQYGEKIPEGSFAYGGGIHIKPENRGKFTKYCGGKVTGDCIKKGLQSKDAHIRQMANFARNARKWKKYAEGGDVDGLVRAVDNGEGKFMSTDAGMMVGVEMEKGEMYTTPDGETKEVEGKTHEEGGTKMAVPDGSYVWSDRISAITGETIKKGDKDSIAHAVKKEMKKIERLEKILKEDTTDKIHKNTYKRQMEISQQELLRLKALQDLHEKREEIKKAMFNHLEKGDKADENKD